MFSSSLPFLAAYVSQIMLSVDRQLETDSLCVKQNKYEKYFSTTLYLYKTNDDAFFVCDKISIKNVFLPHCPFMLYIYIGKLKLSVNKTLGVGFYM